jgi:hypothetical protein
LPSAGFALSKASVYPGSSSSAKARCVEQQLNSLSIIISNVPIKAKLISCSSLHLFAHHHDMLVASNVTNASAVCLSSINAPHEYFDHTGIKRGAGYSLHVREPGWHEHRMFNGPANEVNLHVFSAGCSEIDRMLMLRNWLRTSERDRELYGQTKRMLGLREWKYTQNYADAKTSVIEEILSRARARAMEENYPR